MQRWETEFYFAAKENGGEGGNNNNKEVFICDTNTVFCAKTAFWIKTILSQMSHTVKSLKLAFSVFSLIYLHDFALFVI